MQPPQPPPPPPGYTGPNFSPPGPPGGGPPGPFLKRRGVVTERNGVTVILLSIVTCGIYHYVWLYQTGAELKEALQDEEIKPGVDVLLSILTCYIWSMYAEYRNAQKVHRALLEVDPYAKDQSSTVLILNLASLLSGITWVIGTYVLQEELNKLARS